MAGLAKTFLGGIVWTNLQNWGEQLVALIVFTVLARLLPAESFGIIALANLLIRFSEIFLDQGFAQSIIQRREINEKHLNTAFTVNLLMSVLFTVGFILASNSIAAFFNEPKLSRVIIWLSPLFFVSAFYAVQDAILQRGFEFKKIALRRLVAQLIAGTVGVVTALAGFDILSLVWYFLVVRVIDVLLLWWITGWYPKLQISVPHFKDLFSFGIGITGMKITQASQRKILDFVIGKFWGAEILGYYTIARKITRVVITVSTKTISRVMFPILSRMQSNKKKLVKNFNRIYGILCWFIIPIFGFLWIAAKPLIEFTFGQKWLQSVALLKILVWIGILEFLVVLYKQIILAKGRSLSIFTYTVSSLIASLIAVYLAIDSDITVLLQYYVVGIWLAFPVILITLKKEITLYFSQHLTVMAKIAGGLFVFFLLIGIAWNLGLNKIDNNFLMLTVLSIVMMLFFLPLFTYFQQDNISYLNDKFLSGKLSFLISKFI